MNQHLAAFLRKSFGALALSVAGLSAAQAQYCTPAYENDCSSDDVIDSLQLSGDGGTSIVDNATGCSANNYDVSGIGASAVTLTQAGTYTMSISSIYGINQHVRVWIDFDNDNAFEDGESIGMTDDVVDALTPFTLTIPGSAAAGQHRMRVRLVWNVDAVDIDPCDEYGYGEAHDYTVTIAAGVSCAGTPSAGTITASNDTVCPSATFVLQATGFTPNAPGLSYQWQSAPAGSATFTNISGATTVPYTISTGQSIAMDYRLIVMCAGSMLSDTSNTLTIALDSFLNCYCTSAADNPEDEEILNVTLSTINNTTACTNNLTGTQGVATGTPGQYSNWSGSTVPVPAMGQAMVVPFSVQVGTCGTGNYSNAVKIFVDWNRDGDLTDAGEEAYASPGTTLGAHTETGTILVPAGASPGNTLMRVLVVEDDPLFIAPCDNYSYGETEDYIVNIVPGTPCAGMVDAGVLSLSDDSVCSGVAFSLNATGYTIGTTGLVYQWQSAPAGSGMFTNISGATTVPYNVAAGQTMATDYRLIVTCTNSAMSDTSAAVTVGMNSFYQCYCSQDLGGADASASIDSVTIVGTTLANATPGNAPTYYTAYPASGNTTATLYQGNTYNLYTAFGDGPAIASLWIDYDHSGIFEADEFTQITTNASAATISFIVPATAQIGLTGLRIRSRAINNDNGAGDACTVFGSGETEDYIVNILAACTPPTVFIGNDTAICVGDSVMLTSNYPAGQNVWSTGSTDAMINVPAGTYYLTVDPMGDGCTGSDTIVISTVPAPEAGTLTATGTSPAFTFSASGNSGSSYLISFGDGSTPVMNIPATHTYMANGTYTVTLIAINDCGEVDTATTTVTVTGLGINAVANSAAGLRVFPNPASSSATVSVENGLRISTMEVVDAVGRVVILQPVNATNGTLNVGSLSAGVYTLRIQTNSGTLFSKLEIAK